MNLPNLMNSCKQKDVFLSPPGTPPSGRKRRQLDSMSDILAQVGHPDIELAIAPIHIPQPAMSEFPGEFLVFSAPRLHVASKANPYSS